MVIEQVLFWILAFGAVFASCMVILPPGGKNPLYGAMALVVSFMFVAGLYVLLVAHLMAALQILVYAGAIMVLFMFVIMLLNLSRKELETSSRTATQTLFGVIAVGFVTVKTFLLTSGPADSLRLAPLDDGYGTVEAIGDTLFRQFLLPFELTSILLLVAIIGAVVLAKRTL